VKSVGSRVSNARFGVDALESRALITRRKPAVGRECVCVGLGAIPIPGAQRGTFGFRVYDLELVSKVSAVRSVWVRGECLKITSILSKTQGQGNGL